MKGLLKEKGLWLRASATPSPSRSRTSCLTTTPPKPSPLVGRTGVNVLPLPKSFDGSLLVAPTILSFRDSSTWRRLPRCERGRSYNAVGTRSFSMPSCRTCEYMSQRTVIRNPCSFRKWSSSPSNDSRAMAEYLFPTPPNRRPGNFKRPHRWDLGKKFRQLCQDRRIEDLRIHDLRHTGPTVLLAAGVPETFVSKLTGHRSREVRNYQHLSPPLKQQTVDLIAQVLTEAGDIGLTVTATDTVSRSKADGAGCGSRKLLKKKGKDGRPERTRTADLYRVKVGVFNNLGVI